MAVRPDGGRPWLPLIVNWPSPEHLNASHTAPMKTEQKIWTETCGWTPAECGPWAQRVLLVLVFGGTAALRDIRAVKQIRDFYPAAYIFGCSTAGEICGTEVWNDSLVVTAIYFEHTQVRAAQFSLDVNSDGQQAGE